MDIREKLLRYRDLRREAPDEAQAFLESNRDDERFVHLVNIGSTFIEEFKGQVEQAKKDTTR